MIHHSIKHPLKQAKALISAVALVFLYALANQPNAKEFKFLVLGSNVSNNQEAYQSQLKELLGDLKEKNINFAVHLGGLQLTQDNCSDNAIEKYREIFQESTSPFIYLPGTNDWIYCSHKNPKQSAREKLTRIRESFFPDTYALGKPKLRLIRQSVQLQFSMYAENTRWEHENMLFITLNIPTNNNNYSTAGGRNGEFEERSIATKYWLDRAFVLANQHKNTAIVILAEADPFSTPSSKQRFSYDGYQPLRTWLADFTTNYSGQVLYIHQQQSSAQPSGMIDQPLKNKEGKNIKNFMRLAAPTHQEYMEIMVNPTLHKPFQVKKLNFETTDKEMQ